VDGFVGGVLSVGVTGSKKGFATTTVTSDATSAVVGALIPTKKLSLGGEARFGETLAVTAPTFEVSGVEVSYTWSWATGRIETPEPSLVVPWGAVGERITLFIDWSKEGYADNSQRFDTDVVEFTGGVLRPGVIEDDEYVLSPAEKDYLISEPIQIPPGVTLVVMPGVQMQSANIDLKLFWINGELDIRGTTEAPVKISGPLDALFWTYASSSLIKPVISAEVLQVDGEGKGAILPPTGNGGPVKLTLWGSTFKDMPDYSYLWYPEYVWIIENEFDNAGGFSIGTNRKPVTFEGNVFRGDKWDAGLNGSIFSFWAMYGGNSYIKIKGNTFRDSAPFVAASELELDEEVDLSLNFWGDRTEVQITQSILDQAHSLDFGGTVLVMPFLSMASGHGDGRGIAFTSISQPEISPSSGLSEGVTLNASVEIWSPSPDSIQFQWKRNGVPIAGATNGHYVLSRDDVGSRVSVSATGDKPGYVISTLDSAQSSMVAAELSFSIPGNPIVSGTPVVGRSLSGNGGMAWTPTPATYAWQWLRNGSPIVGATSQMYTLTDSDVGYRLALRLTGSRTGYTTGSRTSVQTSAVLAAVVPAFDSTSAPYLHPSEIVRAYGMLESNLGSGMANRGWSPEPTEWQYQWLRNGISISGAIEHQYETGEDDVGARISLQVTGLRSGLQSALRVSGQTAVVREPFEFSTPWLPTISGFSGGVYSRLQANVEEWYCSGCVPAQAPTSYNYQWLRDEAPILGANSRTYDTTFQDASRDVSVEVTGSRPNHRPATRGSPPVAIPEERLRYVYPTGSGNNSPSCGPFDFVSGEVLIPSHTPYEGQGTFGHTYAEVYRADFQRVGNGGRAINAYREIWTRPHWNVPWELYAAGSWTPTVKLTCSYAG
jgi:hypothetical protein